MRRIVCFSCRKSPADGAELRNRRICWLCVDCWAGFARIGGRLARRAAFSIAIAATKAHAHSFWSNGEEVPAWTKSYCCGPSDVHRLEPSAVHIMPDGYHIDGIKTIVPMDKAMPSPDGQYWAFFNTKYGDNPIIFCFYAPLNGT